MAFYVTIHSDACKQLFPNNRSGNFKNYLNKQYDLTEEYLVAVSSVTRYYETAFNDTVFVREKRAIKQTQVEVETVHPPLDAAAIQTVNDAYDSFIKATAPIIAFSEDKDPKFTVSLNYNGKTQDFTIFPNVVTDAMLKGDKKTRTSYTSTAFEGMKFSIKDMEGVGTLVVYPAVAWKAPPTGAGAKGVPAASRFEFTFSTEFKEKVQLVQASFAGNFALNSPKQEIELRAKNVVLVWEDLRMTQPYFWGYNGKGKYNDKGYKQTYRLFEKGVLDAVFKTPTDRFNYYLEEPFSGNQKSVTIIQTKGPWRYKIANNVSQILRVPEVLQSIPQIIEVLTSDVGLETSAGQFELTPASFVDIAKAAAVITDLGLTLPAPYKLSAIGTNSDLAVKLSEGVRLKLPHAYGRYTVKVSEEAGTWSGVIHRVDETTMDKVEKKFEIPYKKTYAQQVQAFKTATLAAIAQIAIEIETQSGVKPDLPFKLHQRGGVITSIEIPEGFEIVIPKGLADKIKINTHLFSSNVNELAWITSNIVGDMCVGEGVMHLLTPTPLKITTATNTQKEYVPVKLSKFQIIEIKMFTNIKTMEVFDGPYNLMIVLHFIPRYKQKRKSIDMQSQAKRYCYDGCSGGLLQQTTGGGCTQSSF